MIWISFANCDTYQLTFCEITFWWRNAPAGWHQGSTMPFISLVKLSSCYTERSQTATYCWIIDIYKRACTSTQLTIRMDVFTIPWGALPFRYPLWLLSGVFTHSPLHPLSYGSTPGYQQLRSTIHSVDELQQWLIHVWCNLTSSAKDWTPEA